ncbi:hypothetical protein Ahy_B04g073057 isoform A [Arachis hypogaea]|uniref:MULE transposase domain-containing protein n=1 Tax=Arachis hypogaea TaxID=3818 RepID=A0A444ZPI7_ARAHY|nr:hypothetical protein Ahy_B04g073057 isoform A [Arachis hypogaea]
MLRSHQKMSEADIEQMNEMRKRDIPISRIDDFLPSLVEGYENVPYITRDMHNVNAKQRRERGLDVDLCLRYLCECKANDPVFSYKKVIDIFGDVIVFDAMYKKNIYLSPLVVFFSVNHHNQTVVLTATLVADEKDETYVWLLQ